MRFTNISKKILCLLLPLLILLFSMITLPGTTASAANIPTSLGLTEHGINAHRDGWVYAYGGKGEKNAAGKRTSDCAGLIYAYFKDLGLTAGLYGNVSGQVRNNCIFSNNISEGIPRIHGLLLTVPEQIGSSGYSHIGIYIGNNESVDNSTYGVNMRRTIVIGGTRGWSAWHLVDHGTRYPVNGWYALDGKMVHYSSFEYDTNTNIDGYIIGSDGYARTADGFYAPVNSKILSTQYAAASQTAAYLKTKYSGKETSGTRPPVSENDFNGTVTGSGVRVREEPNTSCAIITNLYYYDRVSVQETVIGETVTTKNASSNKWYRIVTASGFTGYISALYVSLDSAVTPDQPTISISGSQIVIKAGTSGGQLHYTTDGSDPTSASPVYSNPLSGFSRTYKAVAILNGKTSSVATLTVLSNGKIFTDFTTKDWFFGCVEQAVTAGIFAGTGATTFSPKTKITRIQFVTALANLDGADLSKYSAIPFSDVTNTGTMGKAVAWAADKGYVSGTGNGKFSPNATLTREMLCTVLINYTGLSPSESSVKFADHSDINAWAVNAIYACRDNGIVSGKGENIFDPKGTATRAEASSVMVKIK